MRLRAIIACVLWGSAFAGAKIGLQYAEPIFLSGIRFTLAGLLLVPVMMFRRVDFLSEIRKHWKFMLGFSVVQTFMQYGLFFLGIDKVPGATSSIIVGAGPLIVAVMAHVVLKNDKMTLRKMIAIVLGISGIVFISLAKGSIVANSSSFYAGVGLLLLSVIVGAYTNIMVAKKKSENISPYALTSFANFAGGLMLVVTSLVVEKPTSFSFPIEFYGALLWLAFISSAGFSLWFGLINRPDVKVSELNIWKFLVPVTGSILSWLFVKGESPDVPTVLGMVIITVALLLAQLPERFFTVFKKRETVE
ncbi:MAG: EamA family transporter [Bacteroidales bacterium]|nr:EamA family transporter [Bacteroidales bacterium]